VKRQSINWEKIFANNATDKTSFPKYTNRSYNLTPKKKKTPKTTNPKMGRVST